MARPTTDLDALKAELDRTISNAIDELERKRKIILDQFLVEQRSMRWLENNQIRLLEQAEAVWLREFEFTPHHVSGTRDGQAVLDIVLTDRARSLQFAGAPGFGCDQPGLPKLKPGKYRLIAVAIPIEDDKPAAG